MKKYLPFSTLLLFVFLCACSKNKDKTPPVITIKSPAPTDTFVFLDKIPVNISITDNEQIREVNYTFRFLDDFQYVFFTANETVRPNKPEYSIAFSYDVLISIKATYKLSVTAYDQSGNRTVEDRLIYVNQ